MFFSAIIPTINRITLSRSVYSLLNQDFCAAEFEVIVVNDSGQPLPDMEWQHSDRVKIITNQKHERSVARNSGAAIARGQFLYFLDDDDLLLPGALDSFWNLHQGNDSAWLYGSYQTVDNNGNLIDEFHPGLDGNIFALLVAGESIPLQASFFRTKDFFAAGGFDPTITGPEDRDLGRRIALKGTVAGTSDIVARIRIGEVGSTTIWSSLAELDRLGREKALREQAAYRRLRTSANSLNLKGRICRAYLASMIWNLKHKNFFISASRASLGITFAVPYLVFPEFWRGLRTKIK